MKSRQAARYGYIGAVGISVVCLGWWFWPSPGEPDRGEKQSESWLVGRTDGGLGALSEGSERWREYVPGDRIERPRGLRVSARGQAELRIGQSRLVLGAGARILPISDTSGAFNFRLERGSLRVEAAPSQGPFAVLTEYGRLKRLTVFLNP